MTEGVLARDVRPSGQKWRAPPLVVEVDAVLAPGAACSTPASRTRIREGDETGGLPGEVASQESAGMQWAAPLRSTRRSLWRRMNDLSIIAR